MGLTEKEFFMRKRIKLYKKAIAEKKEQISELRGVETPKTALERSEIQKEITDLTIKMNEVSEQLETEEKSIEYEPDFFND